MPVSGSAANPPAPNDVSLAPFGRYRTSPAPGPPVPSATTISPLDCNAAADGLPTSVDTMPPWPKVPSRAPAVPDADAVTAPRPSAAPSTKMPATAAGMRLFTYCFLP